MSHLQAAPCANYRVQFRIQEAPMLQRTPDRWTPYKRRNLSDQITPILAINGIIVLALIVLALSVPSASEWISAAAQAEFVGGDAPGMTQIAQPSEMMKIVRSN
jgi:hypothetical protein